MWLYCGARDDDMQHFPEARNAKKRPGTWPGQFNREVSRSDKRFEGGINDALCRFQGNNAEVGSIADMRQMHDGGATQLAVRSSGLISNFLAEQIFSRSL